MPTIVFHGRVLPERADFNILNGAVLWTIKAPNGVIDCKLAIIKSIVSVTCTTDGPSPDLFTLRTMVANSVVTPVTDAYGVINGIGFDIEIMSALDIEADRYRVFGADEPIDISAPFPDLAVLVHLAGTELQLRSAMANLRESMRMPDETAFYCYRAIEAVKGYFLSKQETGKDSPAWAAMRQRLNLRAETLKEFKDVADKMRHGIIVPQTWPQRKRQMEIAREAIRRFAFYLGAEQALSSEDFPAF